MQLDLAARRAALTPRRPAVWAEGRWLSYAELNERATRLAARLAEAGVTQGDRVSILAHNHLAHLELILATAKLGFIYAPLNYRLAVPEQRAIAAYLRPKLLLFDAANAAAAEATGLPLVALSHYEAWLAQPATPVPAPTLDPEAIQMILLTGGTTGTPKGAMIPYRQGFYNAVNTVFCWGLREDDCAVQATPCFHAAVNVLAVPLLMLGGRVVLQPTFAPEAYLRLVVEHGATLLFLVPTMYQMLIEEPAFATTDFSRVRWAIAGGAPCPEPVRQALAARGIPFKQGYGLSEAGVNCFAIELEDAARKPHAVGKPMLHAEAAVRRADGTLAAAGEVGELTLRGPHVFAGYFERPEATAEVLREGWLYTGDLAVCDDEGDYSIVGRRKEMFISGGENVYPIEVETVLYHHPAVAECAVLGVPDARWGEVGLAVVVLRDKTVGAEALRRHLKEHLAGYKVPKHFRLVEALPKNAAGKVLKAELRRAFVAEVDDAAS